MTLLRYYLPVLILLLLPFREYAQFTYVNPMPGSQYRNPATSITLRVGEKVKAESLQNANLFNVTGSLSGLHRCNVKLLSEQKTIVLVPENIFYNDEEVTVRVSDGIESVSGNAIKGTSFKFSTRRRYNDEEIAKMRKMRPGLIQGGNDKENEVRDDLPFSFLMFNDKESAFNGSAFFATKHNLLPNLDKFICILNNDSSFSLAKNVEADGADFKINKNGYLTYYSPPQNVFYMLDSNFNMIDSFQCKNGYETEISNHEFLIFPDGRKFFLIDHVEMVDMSEIVPGGYPEAMVEFSMIQEQDSEGNVIFEWASWDHFNITDATFDVSLTAAEIDPFHVNAIEVDFDNNLLISSRNLDEITKINHETGEIIWRMGGKNNQFVFLDDSLTPPFTHQHDIRRLKNGNVTLFDNGNLRTPQISYAKEYLLDEVNKTSKLIWSYKHVPINGVEVCGLAAGNVQRLSNGNTLINYGLLTNFDSGLPNVTEVTNNGDIVWELQFTQDQTFSYRVFKFDWSPCARPSSFTLNSSSISPTVEELAWGSGNGARIYNVQYRLSGDLTWKSVKSLATNKTIRNLLPDTIYEWRVKSICSRNESSAYSTVQVFHTAPLKLIKGEAVSELFTIYPNPSSGLFRVNFRSNREGLINIELIDAIGISMWNRPFTTVEGVNSLELNCEGSPAGIYYILLHTDQGSKSKMLFIE